MNLAAEISIVNQEVILRIFYFIIYSKRLLSVVYPAGCHGDDDVTIAYRWDSFVATGGLIICRRAPSHRPMIEFPIVAFVFAAIIILL